MIFAPDLNLRYYPIPKVACSAIKLAILNASGIEVEHIRIVHQLLSTDRHYVIRAGKITQVRQPPEGDGVEFALVRNPFDRLISAYVNKVVNRNRGLPAPFYETKSFAEFVDVLLTFEPVPSLDGHLRPQYQFLMGSRIEQPGRYERINEDWSRACEAFGRRLELSIANPSDGRSDYRSYYTPELAEKVARYYARDLELYGYEF